MARPDIRPEEVVRLWLEEELSIREMAQRYGCNVNTIKSRMNEARAQMGKERWKEYRRERSERRRARRTARANEAARSRTRVKAKGEGGAHVRREDITVEDVIRLWLREGQSMLAISLQYNTSLATVRRRLDKARKDHPELPWEERKLQQSQAYRSSNEEYVQMNDGKAGKTDTRGSIIRGRRNRPVL